MNLLELKYAVERAIEFATERDENPEEILVSIQIDGPDYWSTWSDHDIRVIYNNDIKATGCVILGDYDTLDS